MSKTVLQIVKFARRTNSQFLILELHFNKLIPSFIPGTNFTLDIVGPLPMTEEGHKDILTCQDNLSKYLVAIPIFRYIIPVVFTYIKRRK
jgi:hypothetical protein